MSSQAASMPASSAPPAPDDCPDPTPLTPANLGHTIGDEADPELDVAPNMGGEEQMQDA